MSEPQIPETENDPRFPSGKWTGFYQQKEVPGKHMMELNLTFSQGVLKGEGRDRVGSFVLKGSYTLEDGKCRWHKRYVGKHDVFYQGFNEGKGIWGKWEIPATRGDHGYHGGFHIWPEGMTDPSSDTLHEAMDLPVAVEKVIEDVEPVAVPAGAGVGE